MELRIPALVVAEAWPTKASNGTAAIAAHPNLMNWRREVVVLLLIARSFLVGGKKGAFQIRLPGSVVYQRLLLLSTFKCTQALYKTWISLPLLQCDYFLLELLLAFFAVQNALKAMVDDAGKLEKAAIEGRLTIRADAFLHKGDCQKIVTGVNNLLDEIVPSINKTSELVQEIASASAEQSSCVSQINSAMGQLNPITQQNASASEQLAATSQDMGGQTAQLQNLMAFFKLNSGLWKQCGAGC